MSINNRFKLFLAAMMAVGTISAKDNLVSKEIHPY